MSWTPTKDGRQHEVIKFRFSPTDCRKCPRRLLSVRPQEQHEALQAAQKAQTDTTVYDAVRSTRGH